MSKLLREIAISLRTGCQVAGKELDELRSRSLNPPEWTRTEVLEFPGWLDGPWARYIDPATVQPMQVGHTKSNNPLPGPLPEGLLLYTSFLVFLGKLVILTRRGLLRGGSRSRLAGIPRKTMFSVNSEILVENANTCV